MKSRVKSLATPCVKEYDRWKVGRENYFFYNFAKHGLAKLLIIYLYDPGPAGVVSPWNLKNHWIYPSWTVTVWYPWIQQFLNHNDGLEKDLAPSVLITEDDRSLRFVVVVRSCVPVFWQSKSDCLHTAYINGHFYKSSKSKWQNLYWHRDLFFLCIKSMICKILLPNIYRVWYEY